MDPSQIPLEIHGVPLWDNDIFKMLFRFVINVFFLALMVKFAIYPSQRNREFSFTAVLMNVTVFFICFSLKKLDLGLGMALGLFAIFGILRYRTEMIRTKEMTYLFIVIGIGAINALSNDKTSYAELLTINLIIFATALLKESIARQRVPQPEPKKEERRPPRAKQQKHTVEYDKLELLGATHRAELLADLRKRTGLDIVRVQVRTINLAQATATLSIWCDDPDPPPGDKAE